MTEYVVPDVTGDPITAWRTWFVVPKNRTNGPLRLQSIVYGKMWEPKKAQKAECRAHVWVENHDAPAEGHGCGIYAVISAEEVNRYYRDPTYKARAGIEIWKVVGTVALWGKIVEGDRGYRAQYAYPTKLQIPRTIKGREQHLSVREVQIGLEHYGCEVEIVEDTLRLM